MTAAQALAGAVRRLAAAGVPDAPRDARRLLAHAMALDPARLTLHLHDPMSPDAAERLDRAVAARVRRQPVAQIVGHRLFHGHNYRVTPDVLDPRPETEVLVEAALAERFVRVLDLGTGSGAILLSLLGARTSATGLGTDLSDAALVVAKENARSLGLAERADFAAGDWWDAVPPNEQFDLIVSNPPYIAESELPGLDPEVRLWEPRLALTPGGDGLAAFRAIAQGVLAHLVPGGRVLVEVGSTQAAAVCAILSDVGLVTPRVLPDLDGRDRVVAARAPVPGGAAETET